MISAKLTNRFAKAASYEGDGASSHIVWDTVISGLGLRVYPPRRGAGSRKAWVLSYRIGGKKRLLVLDQFPAMLVDAARDEAGDALALVRKGVDPLEEKRRKARGDSLGDLIDAYDRQHLAKRKTGKEEKARLDRHIPARWRSRGVEQITRADVKTLYESIGAKKPKGAGRVYEANRLLARLRHMFGWARRQSPSYISKDAIRDGWENPAILAADEKFTERKRRRFLHEHELPFLAEAIDAEPSVYVRAAVWLYLLTGARRSELLAAKRDQIQWEAKRLRLPDTKAGEEQYIVLSGPALAILQGIPKDARNPHLFPGSGEGRALVNISKPWRRCRERATVALWAADDDAGGIVAHLKRKLDRDPTVAKVRAEAKRKGVTLPAGLLDLRIHDLRRSVGSWMTAAGVDLNRIKDALRHADLSTTLIYARLGDDSARAAFEAHGRQVMERAGRLKVLNGGAK